MPRLNAGLKLRTRLSSRPPWEARHLASEAAAAAGLRNVLAGERTAADRLMHSLDLGEVQASRQRRR